MQFYYGAHNTLRALDEAEFWKHQEAEHADLIPVVTPGLEAEYVQTLRQFNVELGRMNAEAVKYIENVARSKGMVPRDLKLQMMNFIGRCIEQSKTFIEFMEELLLKSEAVRANQSSKAVIHHMIRESQYFIGIAQLIVT